MVIIITIIVLKTRFLMWVHSYFNLCLGTLIHRKDSLVSDLRLEPLLT